MACAYCLARRPKMSCCFRKTRPAFLIRIRQTGLSISAERLRPRILSARSRHRDEPREPALKWDTPTIRTAARCIEDAEMLEEGRDGRYLERRRRRNPYRTIPGTIRPRALSPWHLARPLKSPFIPRKAPGLCHTRQRWCAKIRDRQDMVAAAAVSTTPQATVRRVLYFGSTAPAWRGEGSWSARR